VKVNAKGPKNGKNGTVNRLERRAAPGSGQVGRVLPKALLKKSRLHKVRQKQLMRKKGNLVLKVLKAESKIQ